MSAFGWPARDTWWRRAWSAIRRRSPHVHLWRSRTINVSTEFQRYDALERSCRCGDRHVIGAPPPGPSPLIRMAKVALDSGILVNSTAQAVPAGSRPRPCPTPIPGPGRKTSA